VVERIESVLHPTAYNLKIALGELDAKKLAEDVMPSGSFACPECGAEMAVSLAPVNLSEKIFKVSAVCPGCNATKK
jgi:hypothetical protein